MKNMIQTILESDARILKSQWGVDLFKTAYLVTNRENLIL